MCKMLGIQLLRIAHHHDHLPFVLTEGSYTETAKVSASRAQAVVLERG